MSSQVTLLVGTTKGAFLLTSAHDRESWSLTGPHCEGWPINHAIGCPDTGSIWAAGGGEWNGAGVWHTQDRKTWSLSKLANGQIDGFIEENPEVADHLGITPTAPGPFSGQIDALWSLALSGDALYAGAKPASLFKSVDRGTTWEKVDALTNHPSAKEWNPGAAGLTLHTIVPHPTQPQKLWVGISAAGVFATEDGGASWDRRNRRSNAAAPETLGHPAAGDGQEIGQCVHNMVRARDTDTGGTDVLYQQNHHGVYRSSDGGRSWHDITGGLPSTFGFPVAVHPHDPLTIWTFPLNGDSAGRFPPDASAAVWKSDDGGESWSAKQDGLPTSNCFFTVLRQAMATDRCDPAGVYFGTNSGSVFASADEGESWSEIAHHLPTVLCVETMQTT